MPDNYKIVRRETNNGEIVASTWTVIYVPTCENLSHHESDAEARAAVRRYEAADKRRKS